MRYISLSEVLELQLILNGYEIYASVDDQEQVILGLASGDVSRDKLIEWLTAHIDEIK